MTRFRVGIWHPGDGREETAIKAGLSGLAEELIQEVVKHLRWPTDFYTLSLVSRLFWRHATPELYSTLVLAYLRPERINALLALLEKSPEHASFIKTLLFDEDVKSIGPNLRPHRQWPPITPLRDLTDGWNPDSLDTRSVDKLPRNRHHMEIARRIQVVLPTLSSLTCIIMRSAHPSYIHLQLTDTCARAEEQGSSSGESDSPDTVNIWHYMLDVLPHINEIYVNSVHARTLTGGLLSSLTTICISDLFIGNSCHLRVARMWNKALSRAHSLQTLCMVQVQHAHIILDGHFFPQLQALELFMVYLEDHYQTAAPVFIDFLYRHSPTLRIMALSSPVWGSIDHAQWLRDKNILPNLHTLRLDHVVALLFKPNDLLEDPVSDAHARVRTAATETYHTSLIIEFIRHRPRILDVGIHGLHCPAADKFARVLLATRPMRSVLLGTSAAQSLAESQSSNPKTWKYEREMWAFYRLFSGLTITKSGFRPIPPHRPWRFWKKIL